MLYISRLTLGSSFKENFEAQQKENYEDKLYKEVIIIV